MAKRPAPAQSAGKPATHNAPPTAPGACAIATGKPGAATRPAPAQSAGKAATHNVPPATPGARAVATGKPGTATLLAPTQSSRSGRAELRRDRSLGLARQVLPGECAHREGLRTGRACPLGRHAAIFLAGVHVQSSCRQIFRALCRDPRAPGRRRGGSTGATVTSPTTSWASPPPLLSAGVNVPPPPFLRLAGMAPLLPLQPLPRVGLSRASCVPWPAGHQRAPPTFLSSPPRSPLYLYRMTGVLGTAVARGPQVALNRAWPTAGRWSGPPGRNLYRPGRASRVHGGAAGAL